MSQYPGIPDDSHLAKILPSPAIGGPLGLASGLSVARYVNLAALVLLFYDHLITFDLEVERIWTLPWRLPKSMFMLNRYILNPSFIFGWVVFLIYDNPLGFCRGVWIWKEWPSRMTIMTVQLIMVTRLLALYNADNKVFRWAILGAWTLEAFSILALNIHNLLLVVPFDAFGLVPGCLTAIEAHWVAYTWIPPIIFESLTIVLILYKFLPAGHRNRSNRTLHILARDSTIYFVAMLAIHSLNLVIWSTDGFVFGDAYATPSSVMASIAVSRMMMNLRGLASDVIEARSGTLSTLDATDDSIRDVDTAGSWLKPGPSTSSPSDSRARWEIPNLGLSRGTLGLSGWEDQQRRTRASGRSEWIGFTEGGPRDGESMFSGGDAVSAVMFADNPSSGKRTPGSMKSWGSSLWSGERKERTPKRKDLGKWLAPT